MLTNGSIWTEFGKKKDKRKNDAVRRPKMDQYKVVTRIGEGAHGVVLLARHLKTGASVALKKVAVRAAAEGLPHNTLREVQVRCVYTAELTPVLLNVFCTGVGCSSTRYRRSLAYGDSNRSKIN